MMNGWIIDPKLTAVKQQGCQQYQERARQRDA